MKQILIGITGPARAGKTTTANHLASEHGFECYAFADPLKQGIMAIFNLSPEDIEGENKEKTIGWLGRSPRQLMQLLGTEWGRHMISADLWINLAQQNLDCMSVLFDTVPGFVISDVRFENEADFIRKRGGIIVHLQRPDAETVNPHISEAGVSVHPDDLVLLNDASEAELIAAIDQLHRALRTRDLLAVA
ncbi:deoxynucleotide monophosphate kinase [Pseudomonas sp. Irchel 3A5]|uniref:deoxynucleotide monophosphate kinase family protein n=1 Tax=Pseudomonas sp. Irchel 3A5 TaxID=2008911 RepID=UPI000BA36934|nr:deoxynucleotide monophosphate kinase [Pseudomonas sp. Irchel 3A5]